MPVRRSLVAALLAPVALAAQGRWQPPTDPALVARARAIHERVLTLDTHVDINPAFFGARTPNYVVGVPRNQVDVPKMEQGGLDAAFLIVYVGQGKMLDSAGYAQAYASAIEKFDAIHHLVDSLAPTRVGLATSVADVRRIAASGRKVILIGVENGFQLGSDIRRVREFRERGALYLSLAHNGHSQLSDSNTGERDGVWLWNGLSPLGKDVIRELNRWGVMIDVSHPSKRSMLQTIELSRAPIIASHSSMRALCDHSRNLDDEQLRAIKRNRGVVQVVAFNAYVKCDPVRDRARDSSRFFAIEALRAEYGIAPGLEPAAARAAIAALPDDTRNAYLAAQEDITARRYPADPAATVSDFVDHIDHAVKVMGIDHVGISSDFDGGGGVDGWRSAAETLNVTLELVKRGYTEAQIAQLWSGNLLRVLGEVEAVSARLRGSRASAR
ncbi:MAG: dipeptidase [Gemmatimonadaceae bacterium]|nr:dipeptidase [Gemmatimonadaceae bacterium]